MQATSSEHMGGGRFKKYLTTLDLVLLGIGAIVGAGIFTTIGSAALGDAERLGAGPSLMLSFVLTSCCCFAAAMCYGEFASMVPVSGSAYTYSYAAFGELWAWIIGWDLTLEYAISNIAVAVSWANYFCALLRNFGIYIPWWLAMDYRSAQTHFDAAVLQSAPHLFGIPIVFNLVAASITLLLTLLLIWGIKESARVNAWVVIMKMAVLLFFVGIVAWAVPLPQMQQNWQPFFPNGLSGTLAGSAVVFFAYIGFDTLSTLAEECEAPQKSLPRAIVAALIACTVLYVLVCGVFTGAVSQDFLRAHHQEAVGQPLALVLEHVLPASQQWVFVVVTFGAVLAQTATLLVYQLGQPRIFLSMARDGLLPPFFARIHPRFGTPHVTTLLTGLAVALGSTFVPIDQLIDLTNIGTLSAFLLVCLGIPILRCTDPERPRSFKVPGGPWLLPGIGAACNMVLLGYLPASAWWRFVGWLGCGLGIYAMYGYHHSVLGQQAHRQTYPWQRYVGAGLSTAGLLVLVFAARLGLF